MLKLVGLLWLVFRAPDFSELGRWISEMLTPKTILSMRFINWDGGIIAGIILTVALLWMESKMERGPFWNLAAAKRSLRWLAYTLGIALILLFGRFGSGNFIYFQF